MKNVKLTNGEKALLLAITRTNFYEEGFDSQVWTGVMIEENGLDGKEARGTIASLVKKGCVVATSGKDGTIKLLDLGIDYLKSTGLFNAKGNLITSHNKKGDTDMTTTFKKDAMVIYGDEFATVTTVYGPKAKYNCEITSKADGKKHKVMFSELDEMDDAPTIGGSGVVINVTGGKVHNEDNAKRTTKAKPVAHVEEPKHHVVKAKVKPHKEEAVKLGNIDDVFDAYLGSLNVASLKSINKNLDNVKLGNKVGEYVEEIMQWEYIDIFAAMEKAKEIDAFKQWVEMEGFESMFAKYLTKKKSKGGGYWDNEKADIAEGDTFEIRNYEAAGKLQIYGKINTDRYKGLSKAVVLHTGDMTDRDAVILLHAIGQALSDRCFDDRFQEALNLIDELRSDI